MLNKLHGGKMVILHVVLSKFAILSASLYSKLWRRNDLMIIKSSFIVTRCTYVRVHMCDNLMLLKLFHLLARVPSSRSDSATINIFRIFFVSKFLFFAHIGSLNALRSSLLLCLYNIFRSHDLCMVTVRAALLFNTAQRPQKLHIYTYKLVHTFY